VPHDIVFPEIVQRELQSCSHFCSRPRADRLEHGVIMKLKLMTIDQTFLAFATPIRQFRYSDVDEFNRELASRVLAMRDASAGLRQSNVGGWHSDREFLQNLDPQVANRLVKMFVDNVTATVTSVAEVGDTPLPQSVGVECWANVNQKGDSNATHIHGGCAWSGVYYVAADPSPSAGGDLFFIDPRTSALMVTHPYNIFKSSNRMAIRPQAGNIVIFPSFLYHGVDPYLGDTPRISIAFNLA
jgi:uncharacterized protein (TIGR02466 family)